MWSTYFGLFKTIIKSDHIYYLQLLQYYAT